MYRIVEAASDTDLARAGLPFQIVTPGFHHEDVFVCAFEDFESAEEICEVLNCVVATRAA